MHRIFLLILLAIAPCLAFGQTSSFYGAAKYSPPNGKRLLIIGQDIGSVGGLDDYTNGYVDNLNQTPAGITTYTGFPGVQGLTTKANWGAGDIHAQAYSDDAAFDNTTIVIGLHLVGQLSSIVNGYSDTYIQSLGQWIKDQQRPVFLRIGYEFDGSWNGYDPTFYKNAWIYIVKYFDNMNIRNVAYVWQSAGINTANIDRWYPGDDYVNWVGYSHFDGANPGHSIRAFAEAHDKPIMICEATPRKDLSVGDGTQHWQSWFEPLFNSIYGNERIKALAYINADWESQSMWKGQGWGDSRVQINDVVKANWLNEVAKDTWLFSSEDLFETLQYQLWQDSVLITGIHDELLYDELRIKVIEGQASVSTIENATLYEIHIYDFYGRKLYSNHQSNSQYVIPFEDRYLNAGIILKVRMKDRWSQMKMCFIQ